MKRPIEERLFARREVDEHGCWLWTGTLQRNGYGKVYADGRTRLVHRVAYEHFIGPIPEGLTLDHVRARGCRSRRCFNPAHLEPVTNDENLRRGDGSAVTRDRHERDRRDECPQGHALAGENVYIDRRGCRGCVACRRAAGAAYDERNRALRAERARERRARERAGV